MCGFIGVKKTKLLTDEKIMESFKTLKKRGPDKTCFEIDAKY